MILAHMIPLMEQFFADLGTLLNRGGYVMIPLLLLSICSVTLIIERCFFGSPSTGERVFADFPR